MELERLAQYADSAVKRLHVRSALNPILWLCGIAMPILLGAAYAFRDVPSLRNFLIIASLVPLAVACGAFIYFAIVKPEKLQSEDYQLRHESLQIIQQKGGPVVIQPAELVAIANPEARRLGPGD